MYTIKRSKYIWVPYLNVFFFHIHLCVFCYRVGMNSICLFILHKSIHCSVTVRLSCHRTHMRAHNIKIVVVTGAFAPHPEKADLFELCFMTE